MIMVLFGIPGSSIEKQNLISYPDYMSKISKALSPGFLKSVARLRFNQDHDLYYCIFTALRLDNALIQAYKTFVLC